MDCRSFVSVVSLTLIILSAAVYADPFSRRKRQTIGSTCNENIDCLTSNGGAFCDSTKVCACLPTSVNIAGFCWPKINPGQSGCLYSDQCNAIWPGSTCDSTSSCICPNNQPPHRTSDGLVCANAGACPTNGLNSKLKDTIGVDVQCQILPPPCGQDYECFCSPPQPLGTPCGPTTGSITYCCPPRALVCILPKEEGVFSGGLRQNKWYYNAASSNCEQLFYNGAGGNGNNFESKLQCESYCKTACSRGRPQYAALDNLSDDLLRVRTIVTCTSSGSSSCATNYACSTSVGMCCPSSSIICGANGGRPDYGAIPIMPDSGSAALNLPQRTRYWYDTTSSICRSFTYNGQGGNYNNFGSAAECNLYCASSLCSAGDTLRDGNQNPLRCGTGGSSVCPSRYSCSTSGYCCPSKDFVCNQPVAVGSCLNYVQRWYYDARAGSCAQFTYNGCQGNANNFNSYTDCITFCTDVSTGPKCPQGTGAKDSNNAFIVCSGTSTSSISSCPAGYYCYYDGRTYGCCPTATQTCAFDSVDSGTACVTPVTRWYLNTQTLRCQTFTYNGCDGNSNNFPTQIDCQDYCGVGGCPAGGEPYRQTVNGQYQACTTSGQECPPGYSCARIRLGTSTLATYCCPNRETICRMAQDVGTTCGTNTLTRWNFNTNTRTCESFVYRGCGGNRNNFASQEICSSYCNSAACPSGQVALQDITNRQLTTCTVGTGTGCPSSFTCVTSSLLNQGICCGSNAPTGTCPSGQAAYMDPLTNGPLQCQQNVDGQCQTGYFCQYSVTQANSFCCGTSVVQCPQGGNVFINAANQAQQCTPNVANNCASGYTCQATTILVGTVPSATGYCCGTPNPCGTGFTTLFVNNVATTCDASSTVNTCTSPYSCVRTVSGQGYCCVASIINVAVCAVGKTPLLILNVPTICTSGSSGSTGTGCPSGYTCDLYAPVNSFYCCSTGTVIPPTTQRCPTGFQLLQPEQTCGTSPDTCPRAQGYFCSFDSTTRRYVCCGNPTTVTNPCPAGSTAQINPSTNQAQVCALGGGGTGCATNFNCQYSSGNYYCCSRRTGGGGSNGCPSGVAYLFPGLNSPLACTTTGPRCPAGYSCVQSTTSTNFQCCSTSAAVPNTVNAPTKYVCTGSDYCKTKLKHQNASCDMSLLKCVCGQSENYDAQRDACISVARAG